MFVNHHTVQHVHKSFYHILPILSALFSWLFDELLPFIQNQSPFLGIASSENSQAYLQDVQESFFSWRKHIQMVSYSFLSGFLQGGAPVC